MKRQIIVILLVTLAIFGGAAGFFSAQRLDSFPAQPAAPSKNISAPLTNYSQKTAGLPKMLIIDKIGVRASVEEVGLDSQQRMDVPKDWYGVGWYKLGVRPGEIGSAVLDGHLDTPTGPAVFWNLSNLKPGDQIEVLDDDNKSYIFLVTSVESYKFDEVPLQNIFAANDKPRLNLITCVGAWDSVNRNYSDRLVVYSVLES